MFQFDIIPMLLTGKDDDAVQHLVDKLRCSGPDARKAIEDIRNTDEFKKARENYEADGSDTA